MSDDSTVGAEGQSGRAVDPFGFIGIDHPEKTCVVCLAELEYTNRTREHVYPQWLQAHVEISKKHLTLPDGRLTQYDQLLVPLCATCNHNELSKLEDQVANLTRQRILDSKHSAGVLYLWLFKIFVLNQIFSLTQPGWSFEPGGTASNGLDPAIPNVGLRRLSQTRASWDAATASPPPGSLILSRVADDVVRAEGPFDWYDNPMLGAARLRIDDVVLHACFEDDSMVAAHLAEASSYDNPFDTPMTFQEHYDFSAAFFANAVSIRRPRFLFLGETGVVPAGAVHWAQQDRDTWHSYWQGFQKLWATARGLQEDDS